ncbi:MAG: cation:proton antiporter, partial [Woeseiaceae bacterium]
MELGVDIVSWFSLLVGGILVFIGGLGALRMPDLYTRMHAVGLTDSMGSIL